MFRRHFIGLIFILIPIFGIGQGHELLPALLNSQSLSNSQRISNQMAGFVSDLQKKKSRYTEKNFLKVVFRESHHKYFKSYQLYSQFADIFEKGYYDCLSATSFLSVLLEEFDFDYKIIETNYHIFLYVETKDGPVLLESTDKFNGIVTDAKQIDERISKYKTNELVINPSETDKNYYDFSFNLYQQVLPYQLPGLLYFNQAVVAYNHKNLVECADKLIKASRIYESPRTAEFAVILVKSVVASDLDEQMKKELIRPFVKYLRNSNSIIASR